MSDKEENLYPVVPMTTAVAVAEKAARDLRVLLNRLVKDGVYAAVRPIDELLISWNTSIKILKHLAKTDVPEVKSTLDLVATRLNKAMSLLKANAPISHAGLAREFADEDATDRVSERVAEDVEEVRWANHEARMRQLYPDQYAPPPQDASLGAKYDAGKDPWHLLPWREVRDVVRVLAHGSKKYAADSWQSVPQARERYYSAAMRHVYSWYAEGEATDPESGLPHLAHAACNMLFLAWFDTEKRTAK